jgi:hypothetical protein
MRFEGFSFGHIRIDGVDYEHDVVIDRGRIRKRKKKPSKNASSKISWRCLRRKPNSFRFVSSLLRMNCSWRVASGFGCHRLMLAASVAGVGPRGTEDHGRMGAVDPPRASDANHGRSKPL